MNAGAPRSGRTGALAALAFALLLAAYLPTLAPGLTGEDSGDFLCAARVFGIPHPPGYPLWCILAGGLARALPVEPFARAVNLTSALFGAGAAAACVALARRIGCGAWAALSSGLLFGLSRSLWASSVVAEIYSLHALLAVLLLGAALRARDEPSGRNLAALGLAAGSSLAHHPVMRGLVPLALLCFAGTSTFRGRRRILAGLGGLLLGLSVLLYLPLRAAASPEKNWGDPRTGGALLDHLLLRQYEPPPVEGIRWPTMGFGDRISILGEVLLREFPAPALLLAAAGVLFLVRSDRRGIALLLGTAFASTVGIAAVSAGRDVRFYPPDYGTYSLPGFAALAILAGRGLEEGLRLLRKRARAKVATALSVLLATLFPALAFAFNRSPNDRSRSTLAVEYGRAVLDSVEPGGVLIGHQRAPFMLPCEYLQIVEGYRRDVLLADRTGRIEPALLGPLSSEEAQERNRRIGSARRDFDEDLAVRRFLGRRPIFLSRARRPPVPGFDLAAVGLLYRVVREGTREADEARARDARLWRGWRFESLGEDRGDRGVVDAEVHVRLARARHLLERSEAAAAVEDYDTADTLRTLVPAERTNLGAALLRAGRVGEAEASFRRALEEDPAAFAARANLGHLLASRGRHAEAAEVLHPLADDPQADGEDLATIGACLEAASRSEQAIDLYRGARSRFPREVRFPLAEARLLLRERSDCASARALAEGALVLEPGSAEARALLEEIASRCR